MDKVKNATMLALTATGALAGFTSAKAQDPEHPNVVVIITDQQQQGKLSYYGDTALSTPWMDRIARNGYSFANGHCAFPLSIPQRFSMFSGMYPCEVNLRANPQKTDRSLVDMDKIEASYPRMLGSLFNEAGYDTFYGGKAHLVSREINEDPKAYGFQTVYATDRRNLLGADAAEFLSHKTPNDKPFLMVVSYINPHDICEFDDYVDLFSMDPKVRERKYPGISRVSRYINETLKYEDQDYFYSRVCPQLPENFGIMDGEPDGMPGHLSPYTDRQWQLHRWVYDRLVEEVDCDIAPVIVALEKGGFMDNTIIVFVSDHGDMDASHHREHKSVPFEEAQNVPFIISGPGIRKGVIDRTTSINTGVDFLPTLCDLANIPIPEGYPGISLKPLVTGAVSKLDRKYVFCEGANWYQVIEDGRYKLTLLEIPGHPAILVDLSNDKGEMLNLAGRKSHEKIQARLTRVLEAEMERRGVPIREDNYGKPHY